MKWSCHIHKRNQKGLDPQAKAGRKCLMQCQSWLTLCLHHHILQLVLKTQEEGRPTLHPVRKIISYKLATGTEMYSSWLEVTFS